MESGVVRPLINSIFGIIFTYSSWQSSLVLPAPLCSQASQDEPDIDAERVT